MGRFLLVAKKDKDQGVAERIRNSLDCHTCDSGAAYDGIIVLGGDGTVLRAVARYRSPPTVYAVNRGRVGFLCPIPYAAVDELIARLKDGREMGFVELKRLCLAGRHYFLNEAVIKPSSMGLGRFRISIDNVSVKIRGDAVIVATRTGSSAYNASLNGPLLLSEGIIVNVVAPNRCSFKPIVCDIGSRVRVEVDGEPLITLDGMPCREKSLDICHDGSTVRFGHLDHYDESERVEGLFLL
ncbi:similarity to HYPOTHETICAL PROTEIN YB04_AERPE (UPF0119 FAMILY) [Encephalitozoon cuniculi GB-M1]|uniref:NAD(+) kinase n=2 Tax=Encephalitozoon cuniculi TaxID=6035 RepID=Q8SUZ0_ENCCU|nr:NAD kinase [Encephalitozoon cuniculi GB-M1]AGE95849.1 hypothetical protein ECU07_1050 [Encephalitozoon cuniculi]KMV65830.1 NAD kinase [Encephalitozoon cuniculi EcunIII-L]UYI27268.1 NAD kinase [Encephalitozoon cuniculi]CAD25638.1 similarity to HYPOTHETICAL PROTEIN YB04_AERPE (UPF0119 FAMILY) [Encephalitozoon cuniculi GB-M1]